MKLIGVNDSMNVTAKADSTLRDYFAHVDSPLGK
jgi:hypothetical protein